jgi:hypothetical protein
VEVLPSSTPLRSPDLAAEGEALKAATADTSALSLDDDSTAYTGPSLLEVEGEEDFLPKPKKVSSTQALQALTRSSVAESTAWTVVNADLDESQKPNGHTSPLNIPSASPAAALPTTRARVKGRPRFSLSLDDDQDPPQTEESTDQDGKDSDNDDFLAMKPRVKKPVSPAARSPVSCSPMRQTFPLSSIDGAVEAVAGDSTTISEKASSPLPISKSLKGTKPAEDAEDMFSFEEEGKKPVDVDSSAPQPTKYLGAEDPEIDLTPSEMALPNTATSAPKTVNLPPDPSVAISNSLIGRSMGSYKGKPFNLTPIKDPRLYDEIATMRDVHFFVGSVDGRSGVEAADMGSYRAMMGGIVGGTPRSFSDRLAIEEAMQKRDFDGENPPGPLAAIINDVREALPQLREEDEEGLDVMDHDADNGVVGCLDEDLDMTRASVDTEKYRSAAVRGSLGNVGVNGDGAVAATK